MATNDRTHAGQPGPALSYLGHPCHLAELSARYIHDDERAKLRDHDPRALAQRLGEQLIQLRHRLTCTQVSLGNVTGMAQAEAEHLDIAATAEVLAEYLEQTAQLAYELTHTAVETLDRAGLVAASQQQRTEAANG
jgi:hypothetical protein